LGGASFSCLPSFRCFFPHLVSLRRVPEDIGWALRVSPADVGTLETSAIALVIAIPVSVGAALAIVERLPRRVASVIGGFLELLAGIPSVIIGLWGALTFGRQPGAGGADGSRVPPRRVPHRGLF
jgi:ABC-type phosphate transport system permease subunit